MKHYIGFEEDKIVYLQAGVSLGKLKITKDAICPIAQGVFRNGMVMKAEELKQVFGAFCMQQGLKGKSVTAVLPGNMITLRELTLPVRAASKELSKMVENEMLYYLEDTQENTVDFLVTEENKKQYQTSVLAYSLPNRYLEDYLELMSTGGVQCDRIEISYNALSKLTGYCYDHLNTSVLVNVGPQSIELCLIEQGACVLSRNIRLSLRDFVAMNTVGIMADEVADHINRVMQFNIARHRDNRIDQVLVLCDTQQGAEFVSLLNARLNAPCEQFSTQKIRFSDSDQLHLYAKTLGACIIRK